MQKSKFEIAILQCVLGRQRMNDWMKLEAERQAERAELQDGSIYALKLNFYIMNESC